MQHSRQLQVSCEPAPGRGLQFCRQALKPSQEVIFRQGVQADSDKRAALMAS